MLGLPGAAVLVLALVLSLVEMNEAGVARAIADEKAETCYPLKEAISKWSWGGPIGGCFTTPYSRVAALAQAARRKYRPFTPAEVPPETLRPEIEIIAFPLAHRVVEAVVVAPYKSKDRAAAVQPTRSEETTAEYQNLYGAKFEGVGITATFPLSVLSEENEVRLVTSESEWKARFKLDKVR